MLAAALKRSAYVEEMSFDAHGPNSNSTSRNNFEPCLLRGSVDLRLELCFPPRVDERMGHGRLGRLLSQGQILGRRGRDLGGGLLEDSRPRRRRED